MGFPCVSWTSSLKTRSAGVRDFAKLNIHSGDSDGDLEPNSSDFGSEAFILLTLRETDNFLNQGTLSEGCHPLFRIWYRHAGPDF